MKHNISRIAMLCLFIIVLGSLSVMAQVQKITTTSACRLFADIENVSSVLLYVPKGKEVEVIEFSGDYALIEYEGTKGWISANKTTGQLPQIEEKYADTQNNDLYTTPTQYDRFSILVDKYGLRTGKALFEHKIWKGIDNNMVKDSWGKPLNVKREVNGSGEVEMWTYRKSWLLFKNGVLSEWGPNK